MLADALVNTDTTPQVNTTLRLVRRSGDPDSISDGKPAWQQNQI
jgi:hypothetical protein